MAASDSGAIVLGAIIGGGFVVISQGITVIAEGRRERGRAQREQQRFDRELELRKGERFLDIKQELYSRLDLLVDGFIDYLYFPIRLIEGVNLSGLRSPPDPDLREIRSVRSNIEMIVDDERSSQIGRAVNGLFEASEVTHNNDVPLQRMTNEADAAIARWNTVLAGMKRDLSGDKETFSRAKQAALPDLPRDPRPARLVPRWRKALNTAAADHNRKDGRN